ncbi:UDP-N-acetylmuramate--L-alanine ligase [Aestuariimicrobium kwangyangense]|uniref:UDP-N-acetylmuramate--L-alanine ligase n=1 Tax=Aestuariimicrobium kwangyangense TaxID=396389 RepID=UPI0003FD13C0|nr:UDP-N-acetylmuramate--L-alanine ligase [Aestuariimicrobium kwangyangense]
MALREPIDVQPLESLGRVHFIAIGGAGMSGIAQLFHARGVQVSGSDQTDSSVLRQLAATGIPTFVGHEAAQLGEADTVVVSSAIRETNPELAEARRRGLRVLHRSAALASLMHGKVGVAIAGTHGKTTTTGMTAVMLAAAGLDPSYVIGSPLASSGTSAHLGTGDVFVVEADESDGSFLQYPTTIAVVTNVEADHLDNWQTPQAYIDGFVRFASQPGVAVLVANSDDPGAAELADRVEALGTTVVRYGSGPGADVRLSELDFEGTTASGVLDHGGSSGRIRLQVPGRYNLENAAAAYAVGRQLGCSHEQLVAGAAAFTGTLRRFQLVGESGGVRVYDDYAHHPTELRAALTAARRAVGEGRLIACFQPHLYSRTAEFADEFGEALTLADLAVVTDVYGAREDPVPGVSGDLVVQAGQAHGGEVSYVPDKRDLPGWLASHSRPGDLVMTLGAGDVTLVGPLLVDLLREGTA